MQTNDTAGKPFLGENFLLENRIAEILYHEYAARQPIIDYHNHLPPDQIAADKKFSNLTAVWLNGDHYKWRAMRTFGIPERYITGDASDFEKFEKWAETVPFTIRNPLFHWTHLELRRYFDIQDILSPPTAKTTFDRAGEMLQTDDFSTQNLLRKMNVEVVCTTDDPVDDLRFHRQFRLGNKVARQLQATDPVISSSLRLLPAFRPDKVLFIENEHFVKYVRSLEAAADASISNLQELLDVLQQRVNFFHENGCRLSDHGLEQIPAKDFNLYQVDGIFRRRLAGEWVPPDDALQFRSAVLLHLCQMYHAKGWVQQFHLGALRNNNARLLQCLGPDAGFDSIGDFSQARSLSQFLNWLDTEDQLTKTIIYNLNPRDNEVFATMTGNFNDGSVRGKIQFGSAWWFLDQKDGMEKQLNALSNMGLLSCFVGMLTDSRSFLSFPRHEYFRRILCNLIGRDVHIGELPNDTEWLGGIVADICYGNAKRYFEFPESESL